MFSSFEELRESVNTNGGLLDVSMEDLRDAVGVRKLGVHVRRQIADKLAGAGLGFFPGPDLPTYQEQSVRIYRKGSPVADLVEAVLFPSEHGDTRLREAGGGQGAEVLKQIRALVCE